MRANAVRLEEIYGAMDKFCRITNWIPIPVHVSVPVPPWSGALSWNDEPARSSATNFLQRTACAQHEYPVPNQPPSLLHVILVVRRVDRVDLQRRHADIYTGGCGGVW